MKHNWLVDSLRQQTGFDRSEVRLILASHHLAVTVKEVIRQSAWSYHTRNPRNSNLTNCSFINWCIDKQDYNLSEMVGNGKIITVFCVQLFHNVGYASPILIIKINEGNN